MDFKDVAQKLLTQGVDTNLIGDAFSRSVKDEALKIIDLVKELDPVLTNADHDIRLRGVEVLVKVITSLSSDTLNEQEIQVLSEFLCLRLLDHKTMEKPVLRCLLYLLSCTNKPQRFNKTLLEVLTTKANVQKMNTNSRGLVYEIVKKVLLERRQKCDTIDSDLIYSLVRIMEGENNPENILLCFQLVSYVLKNFQNLEPFIDDLFEWLSSYYPLDYTPGELNNAQTITRSDLVQALYDCFFAHPLNAENLQTLLLEKLEDGLMSTKIESLNCLIKCNEVFPLRSIKDYASTLWTFVRMTCLKSIDTIDSTLLQLCYKSLGCLAKKLSEDDDNYFLFISEMYDELSIAFRNPELNLFEPAARLLANAVSPKLHGFNHIFKRILPSCMNSLASNDLRSISGLAYIFETLCQCHPGTKLNVDLTPSINSLVKCITERNQIDQDTLSLLNAMISFKVDLQNGELDNLIGRLLTGLKESSLDLEECLAKICLNYKRLDIIIDSAEFDCRVGSLIRLVSYYKEGLKKVDETDAKTIITKFSIYLRLLILLLTDADQVLLQNLNQSELNEFLVEIRNIILEETCNGLAEKVGHLHAIVLNKMDEETVNTLLSAVFSSSYCLNLVPNNISERKNSCYIYVPVISNILKSLVVRNHKLFVPIVNLMLNFITSPLVDEKLALIGSQVFKYVQTDEDFYFDKEKHFRVFFLHKQKFYSTTNSEIRIRYNVQEDSYKKYLLICSLAVQIPHLPGSVYKRDYEWLMRELLRVLSSFKDQIQKPDGMINEELVVEIYACIISLIQQEAGDKLAGLIGSLVDLTLVFAQTAQTLRIRKQALDCLSSIANSVDHSELMHQRASVVDKLKTCLSDRKRLVRQSAAEARLRWILVGQPVS